MKQLFIIFLAVCLVLVSGCSSETDVNKISVSESSGYTDTMQDETTTSQTKISNADKFPTTTERSDTQTTEKEVSPETISPKTEEKVKNDKKEPLQSANGTTAENATSSQVTTSTTEKPKEESKKEDTTDSTTSSVISEPTVSKATAADAKAVAEKMVEYINTYRADLGISAATVLPGLTTYAEYRSRQLVSNFAHDTEDERAAATALKYGEYVEPSLYGMTGEPYYTANAREAIAKAGYVGTVDYVAKKLATLIRNSTGHWEYVGGTQYKYIAVGVTYESGTWYCDIAVTTENTYN